MYRSTLLRLLLSCNIVRVLHGRLIRSLEKFDETNKLSERRLVEYPPNGIWLPIGQDFIYDSGDATITELYNIALTEDGSRLFISDGTVGKVNVYDYAANNDTWIDAGNFFIGERFGKSIDISSDGNTFIVGNNFAFEFRGEAQVYEFGSGIWREKGAIISGNVEGDFLGYAVSMSGDGERIAIGIPFFDVDDDDMDRGLVRTYLWTNDNWEQFGDDIIGEAAGDRSGIAIAMSKDGNSLAVVATFNNGQDSAGNEIIGSGQVRVFACSIVLRWRQQGSDIDGLTEYSGNPIQVDISDNGERIVIGYPSADEDKGRVVAYELVGGDTLVGSISQDTGAGIVIDWDRYGQVLSGESEGDMFGSTVSMSGDGSAIFTGAPGAETSDKSGVGYVYTYNGLNATWMFATEDSSTEAFGTAMSGDGNTIATLTTSFAQVFKFQVDTDAPSLSPTISPAPTLAPTISSAPSISSLPTSDSRKTIFEIVADLVDTALDLIPPVIAPPVVPSTTLWIIFPLVSAVLSIFIIINVAVPGTFLHDWFWYCVEFIQWWWS